MNPVVVAISILSVSVTAFADNSPPPVASTIVESVTTACRRRVDASLFRGVIVGSIAPTTTTGDAVENAIVCGDAKSEHEIYELGSISKTFAGIILAKFANQGLLDLDKPISDKIIELQKYDGGKITLRELATHTSGLMREYNGHGLARQVDEKALIGFLQTDSSFEFPVGSYHYSNVGFATIALVLSRISQMSFQQLVQNEVLNPLAMSETAFMTTPDRPASLLPGYDVLLNPSTYYATSDQWVAAGGVLSDLHDMMIYLRANMHPDGSALGQVMIKSQVEGLGWDSSPKALPIWKNGAMTDGFSTVMEFDPTKNLGTIVLGNEFSGPSMSTIGYVAMGGSDTSVMVALTPDFQKMVSGKYVTDDGKNEADIFPTHQTFLGAYIPFQNGALAIRLLSLPGQTMKFAVDNGSDSDDRVLFGTDPTSGQRILTYFAYVNDDANGNPVYDSTIFRAK